MTNTDRAFLSVELMSEQVGADRRQWVHLIPAGTFRGKDGRGPYTLKDPKAVIDASRRHAGKNQIPVDYEHQIINAEKNGKPAPAAGWIVGMQARPDGIWGLVEWTANAAAHIAAREYRYLSPVFSHSGRAKAVELIFNAALTNSPNLDQLTAVANRQENQDMEQLEGLKKLLGLDDGADIAAMTAKVQELLETSANSAAPDPAQFVPIGDFQKVLNEANKLRQGITKAEAETHVSAHIASGHLLPYLKDWAVSLCTVNKAAFDGFVAGVGPSVVKIVTPQLGGRARPEISANGNLTEQELAVCSAMSLTTEEFTKARDSAATNLE